MGGGGGCLIQRLAQVISTAPRTIRPARARPAPSTSQFISGLAARRRSGPRGMAAISQGEDLFRARCHPPPSSVPAPPSTLPGLHVLYYSARSRGRRKFPPSRCGGHTPTLPQRTQIG